MGCRKGRVLLLFCFFSIFCCSIGMGVRAESDKDSPVSISDIYEGDEMIGGTGRPGAQIKIEFPDGNISDTVVEADGRWEVKVPSEVKLAAGIKVTLTHTVEVEADGEITVKNLNRESSLARIGDVLQYTTSLWNPEPNTVLEQVYFTHIFPHQVELLEEPQDIGDQPILYKNGVELPGYVYQYDGQTKELNLLIESLPYGEEYRFVYCVKVITGFNTSIKGTAKVIAAPEVTTLTANVQGVDLGNENLYEVSYNFISRTQGKELPEEVMVLRPQGQANLAGGTTITPPALSPTEVIVEEGIWAFAGWDQASAVITDADVIITGEWVFTETETEVEALEPSEPASPDIPEATGEADTKAPETGDKQNAVLLLVMAGLSFILAAFLIRRKIKK